MPSLLVSEIFGPTFQGEGRSVGKLCSFVRLGGCNLHCHWCDTPYTWAFDKRHASMHDSKHQYNPREEMRRMTIDEVVTELTKIKVNPNLIVISGGEPMLQQEGIADLIGALGFLQFEIETAGTRRIEPVLYNAYHIAGATPRVRYNVSPKLSHSGNSIEERWNWYALQELALRGAIFKFVVTRETWDEDVKEILFIQENAKIRAELIYIMPEGITRQGQIDSMQHFAQPILDMGWNLTPRLHTLIWGDARGR